MTSSSITDTYKTSLGQLWDKLLRASQEDPYIAKEDIYATSLDTSADYIHCQFTTRANLFELLYAYDIDINNKLFLETIARLAHMPTSIDAEATIEIQLVEDMKAELDEEVHMPKSTKDERRKRREYIEKLAKTNRKEGIMSYSASMRTDASSPLKLLWYTVFANVIRGMCLKITSSAFSEEARIDGYFIYKCFRVYQTICPRPWHMGIDELHTLDAVVFTLEKTPFGITHKTFECDRVSRLQSQIMESVAPGMPARRSVCDAITHRLNPDEAVIPFQRKITNEIFANIKRNIQGRTTFFIQF